MKSRLGELDLAHVEGPDSGDLVGGMNHSRGFALRLGKDDVNEVLGRHHSGDLFEVVIHGFGYEGFFIISERFFFFYYMRLD